jgi:DnaB-like helicase C terminal domain
MSNIVALPTIHPVVLAQNQVMAALAHINRHPDTLVRWPFPELDALTGPMGEGEVWFVPAFSGGGKSTFMASCIEAWRLIGKRVFVMPLELQPKRFRTMLACMETRTHPGDALSGQLRADPSRAHELKRLEQAVLAQTHSPYCDTVMVSEQRAINVRGLQTGLMEAKAFRADVVIVDHIDHIGADGKGYDASKEVNHGALTMAQDNGLLLIFTSQLNMDIARVDALSKYRAPQVNHVQFPSVKLQVCTGMVGLYRPLRAPHDAETPEEYASAIKAARAGTANAPNALEPNTMGVVTMKLRNYGHLEGIRLKLAVEHGRVTHLPERDKYSTTPEELRRV